jgi:chorismate mutase/prephenate dehydratase
VGLDELRRKIDAIDAEILERLDRRAELAREVAEEKKLAGLPMHDPERERQVLERVEQHAVDRQGTGLPKASVRAIFREIIGACLALEQPQTVAYMGPPGTFSHIAARTAFGPGARYVDFVTIGEVIDQVARGAATFGVAPIENSTEGGVTATLDALLESDVMIHGELVIEVSLSLMGREPDLSKIRRVYSHPQPLAQCRAFLARELPTVELVTSSSTTAAAREAASDEAGAAIGSRLAAELYDLLVIREGVQDRAENATRFVVLAKSDAPRTGRDKTSLAFSTPHAQGALRRALQIFDDEGINLTRIESRPAPGRRWEYVFFTDFLGHRSDEPVARAIERLKQSCSTVHLLGSYARADAT